MITCSVLLQCLSLNILLLGLEILMSNFHFNYLPCCLVNKHKVGSIPIIFDTRLLMVGSNHELHQKMNLSINLSLEFVSFFLSQTKRKERVNPKILAMMSFRSFLNNFVVSYRGVYHNL